MHELNLVLAYLRQFAEIEINDLMFLRGKYSRKKYSAGEIIFVEGEKFEKVTFILKGLVKKSYLTKDSREFIKEFAWEGQVTTPYASLLKNEAATYTMQAVENTELLIIDYEVIKSVVSTNPKWLALVKALSDFHFVNREEREMELLKNSAQERYEKFAKKYPELVTRLKKQDIAAYLGITPVSFSRLQQKNRKRV